MHRQACSLAVQDCIVLHKMTMARVIPVDKGSKEATFIALAVDFGFNDKVKDLFLNGHMENLEDFRTTSLTRMRLKLSCF
jgi:hypothetical protein